MSPDNQALIDSLMKICAEYIAPLKVLAENNAKLAQSSERLAHISEALATEVMRLSRKL